MSEQFRVLAAAVVVVDGSVLVLRRSRTQAFLPGVWGVPCGKLDFGEDPADAAIRELREESGLDGRRAVLVGSSTFHSGGFPDRRFNVQLNYRVEVTGTAVVLSPEHDAFAWHPVDGLDRDLGIDGYNLAVIAQAL